MAGGERAGWPEAVRFAAHIGLGMPPPVRYMRASKLERPLSSIWK